MMRLVERLIRQFSAGLIGGAVLLATSQAPAAAADHLPHAVLWAWQRAEDLTALDPHEFGVAYMACRVLLHGDKVVVQWRDQPLKVSQQMQTVPVVRVDTKAPALADSQMDALAKIVVKISQLPQAAAVQIDFDALQSERGFYRRLLERVRAEIAPGLPLSITALASWCLFDNWIADLPVDEKVPMMFSLGRDRQKVLLHFRTHRDFLVPGCCEALGVSLEDSEINRLMIPLAKQRKIPVRVYVFTRTAWNPQKLRAVRSMLGYR